MPPARMHFWVSAARGGIVGGLLGAEEIGDELVHPGIGEEQARRLRQQRGRGHDGVLLLLEEIEEGLPDFGGGHGRDDKP